MATNEFVFREGRKHGDTKKVKLRFGRKYIEGREIVGRIEIRLNPKEVKCREGILQKGRKQIRVKFINGRIRENSERSLAKYVYITAIIVNFNVANHILTKY